MKKHALFFFFCNFYALSFHFEWCNTLRIYERLNHLGCMTVWQGDPEIGPLVPISCMQALYIPLPLTMDGTCDLGLTKRLQQRYREGTTSIVTILEL